MRLFYRKEARGVHAAVTCDDHTGPFRTVAIFRKEVDARRFVEAGNRSMSQQQEKEALKNVGVLK